MEEDEQELKNFDLTVTHEDVEFDGVTRRYVSRIKLSTFDNLREGDAELDDGVLKIDGKFGVTHIPIARIFRIEVVWCQ